MALRVLWHNGYEAGNRGFGFGQDVFAKGGGSGAYTWADLEILDGNEDKVRQSPNGDGGGRHAALLTPTDGGENGFAAGGTNEVSHDGDYHAFDGNQTFVIYHFPLYYEGQTGGITPDSAAGNGTVAARFANTLNPSAAYLGIILVWQSNSTSADVKVGLGAFTSVGNFDVGASQQGSNPFTEDQRLDCIVTVEINDGSGNDVAKLYVNGTLEATLTETTGTRTFPERAVPCSTCITNLKTPALALVWFDDLAVMQWDGSGSNVETDPDTTFYCSVAHQPISDVSGKADWTGSPENGAGKLWSNLTGVNEDTCATDSDLIDPTSTTNHYCWFKYKPLVTGVLMGNRMIWREGVGGQTQEGWSLNGATPEHIDDGVNGSAGSDKLIGVSMTEQPHGTTAWTTAAFDALECGMKAISASENVLEISLIPFGEELERPAKACPAVTFIPRVVMY